MKVRSMLLTLVVCSVAFVMSSAQNPQMGTWKLNEAKSKIPAGMMKNTTVTYVEEGDSVKVTTDGTGPDGSAVHTEWTGKFDGKDSPLPGDPTADSRSYPTGNDRPFTLYHKKDGT